MRRTDSRSLLGELAARARLHAGKALWLCVGVCVGALIVAQRGGSLGQAPVAVAPAPPGSSAAWACAMHPHIQRSEPGQCPICGMNLVALLSDSEPEHTSAPNQVMLSERARALAKLRTATVRRQADTSARLRLLGRIEPDETTLRAVTAWTGGRLDRLHVGATGERVVAGQVLATLYSPEVFAAHQDLLLARKQFESSRGSPEASRRVTDAALAAARVRLSLLGVPEGELSRMEERKRPTRAVAIRSPFSGTVIERLATEGAYVATGSPLYRLANLQTLWIQLDAYESDLARVAVGQAVEVSVDALPGELFQGEVSFIDPTLDTRQRTARLRVQVANADGRLRPGMFAQATVAAARTAPGEPSPLVIPATAPLFTGRRAIVYVEFQRAGQLAYEPRTVRLGPRLGEFYPVVAGLSEGQRVVTRGAFVLDADLQIRGGGSMMAAGGEGEPQGGPGAIELSPHQRQVLVPTVAAYLAIQVALADDDLAQAKRATAALVEAAQQVDLSPLEKARAAWRLISGALIQHARQVGAAGSLEGARAGFEPLSWVIVELLARFGNPLDHPLRLAFCPMASGSDGALWVQRGAEIDNAYFGASMLTCGHVQEEVPPGGFLRSEATTNDENRAPAAEGPRN